MISSQKTAPVRSRATRLTLLCRGATLSNLQSRFFSDEPLLPKEINRAEALAQALPKFDDVLHAPERSAAETASVFSREARICLSLRDADYGTWSGRSIKEIAASSPLELQHWMSDPMSAPHDGEPFGAVRQRVVSWLDNRHAKGGNTLAVTHGVVVKLVLASVLDAPLTSLWRVDVEPLGLLCLTSDGRRWAMRSFGANFPVQASDS
ncbi:histidine phosphatase family protein [Ensifer adhaerens]|uniref:histidine phosphatase family protein n=1 Tax=Ensifer adhaerens TaxID=106592 RepID=UPI003CFD707C